MIRFPNCKINLGLHVVGKRPDGYHNIETIFYPVVLRDALEVVTADEFDMTVTGMPVTGAIEDNLCYKAYQLLKKDFPQIPEIKIHLHKAIPMGAGLGGGSSNGAFMLHMLNEKYKLQLTETALISYALQLGSDCPFFIINKPCFATGRGDSLQPVEIDLSAYKMVIVNPGIHVSTKEAFAQLSPKLSITSIIEIVGRPVQEWKNFLQNDFETSVFNRYPEVRQIKDQLYNRGALYASMTGSGSSVFGIFDNNFNDTFSLPGHYFTAVVQST